MIACEKTSTNKLHWALGCNTQVLPNCYLWVEKETGKRHKVLKLPPSTNGVSVRHPVILCYVDSVHADHANEQPCAEVWTFAWWQGMISVKTLSKLAALRHEGALLVSCISLASCWLCMSTTKV